MAAVIGAAVIPRSLGQSSCMRLYRLHAGPDLTTAQVVKLDPAEYLKWVDAPSTGHPVMFDSPLIERMTCTQW